jgi:NAD-dependent DNA ligase
MIQVLSTQEAIVATIESDVAYLINRSSLSYYNTSKFLPTTVADKKLLQRILQRSPLKVDDKTFDDLVDWLREKNPRHPVLKKIGAPVQVKQKVDLPVPMSSLDKKKPNTGDIDTWCERNPGPYIVSDKMDGTSILLEYRSGTLKCYTRGNGTIGQDISYLAPHFKVPQKLTGTWIIRGEVIMSKASFGNWSHAYENARNLASGMVNTKGVHEALKDVDVIVYSVMSPRGVPSAQLAKLKTLGFKVVPFKVFDTISDSVLTSALMARKKASKYEIDGIVVETDRKTNLPTFGSNPKTAIAFKSIETLDKVFAEVVDIEWNISKNGLLKPVLIIKEYVK